MSQAVRDTIAAMRAAVPPGQARLGGEARRLLAEATRALLAGHTDPGVEHERFREIRRRQLCLPADELAAWLRGARVLVTGGTGCIGSTLTGVLAGLGPARLVSLSRGQPTVWPRQPGVDYRHADIRDRRALDRLLADLRPDVVFHLAAQRDPGLAETEVHRTVTTNVLGTRNVLAASVQAGVPQVVCASTGKALRPYSPDVYTASKRAAEWLAAATAGGHGLRVAAARFTHVVDNSLIYLRLLGWARRGVIRLHAPDISFYAQSALESAQLLLVAGLASQAGRFRVHAITDLGWPICLLDLALDVLAQAGSGTPIYFSGYGSGYEETPFPGLYDPATAGQVSPLINALEASQVSASACPLVDAVPVGMTAAPDAAALLAGLADTCGRTRDPAEVRGRLDELSWSLLHATLAAAPAPALARMAAQVTPHRDGLTGAHHRVLEAISQSTWAAAPGLVPPGR
jgi:NAD(P)-dependent dehydrogenase (short-subunit alcohol dehydrogenase family)